MRDSILNRVIKEIRDTSVLKEERVRSVFPYVEFYPKLQRREGGLGARDGKQMLMNRVRDKFQSLTNPYQHGVSLKRDEVCVLLPRIRDKDLVGGMKGKVLRKRLACHSVTPKKKNLLCYRCPLSMFEL